MSKENHFLQIINFVLSFQRLDNGWTTAGQQLDNSWTTAGQQLENSWKVPSIYSLSLVRRQCLLLELYLMVFPVRILIQFGIGRFCFSFLASLVLIRNVLRADITKVVH